MQSKLRMSTTLIYNSWNYSESTGAPAESSNLHLPICYRSPNYAAKEVAYDEQAGWNIESSYPLRGALPTYPGSLLQAGWDLRSRLLELRDENGRESHGESCAQSGKVCHQPSQELIQMTSDCQTYKHSPLTILTGDPFVSIASVCVDPPRLGAASLLPNDCEKARKFLCPSRADSDITLQTFCTWYDTTSSLVHYQEFTVSY